MGLPDLLRGEGLTHRDGFALNLGPEDWQLKQAHSAFSVLATRDGASSMPFGMFLSMDMNVLLSASTDDAQGLLDKVLGIMRRKGYLRYQGRLVLSTFGGHDKTLGGWGWEGFLQNLQSALGEKVDASLVRQADTDARFCSYRRSSCPQSSSWPCHMLTDALRGTTHGKCRGTEAELDSLLIHP